MYQPYTGTGQLTNTNQFFLLRQLLTEF